MWEEIRRNKLCNFSTGVKTNEQSLCRIVKWMAGTVLVQHLEHLTRKGIWVNSCYWITNVQISTLYTACPVSVGVL